MPRAQARVRCPTPGVPSASMTPPSAPTDSAHPPTRDIVLSPRHRWRAYWVAVAVAALTILDLTKVNVALPSIEAALNAGPTELQLVVSGYILTFGLVLVPAGRLGDLRSRRMLFLVGLSLFLVTSLACALALGLAEVVTSRAGGIRLDTLFIDEGFGSLDAETLEVAMRTLDDLRQGGRTVGLISHVESMKEQVTAQLRVEQTPQGWSAVRAE